MGTLSLNIQIIGQDARDNTHDIHIFVFGEAPERTCQTLWALSIPESTNQSRFSFKMDIQAKEETISDKEVSVGRHLIVVYATDAKNERFLRGCQEADVGAGFSLTIKLDCVPGAWSTCRDDDGDGVSEGEGDCDDADPCRSPNHVEARSICSNPTNFPPLNAACLAQRAADGQTASSAPHCNDGLDHDCDGADVACATDVDCDGYVAGPLGDCDDTVAAVNPGATEIFDGIDNNCNGTIDEGYACDVDGDGHAAKDAPDYNCAKPKDDPDDMDAAIHPETTKGDPELGNTTVAQKREGGYVQAALRKFCSTDMANNSKQHRQIDHDGDGLNAEMDGCPTIECDADGDGFSSGKTGCEVDLAVKDCDDESDEIFPGAPERCGDGLRQDCSKPEGYDAPCDDDTDGDQYSGDDDCDKNDPMVHPWATEICNGIDDDCDGLIDEGNPNHEGQMQGTEAGGMTEGNCTDSNNGKCGEKKGYCVCSIQTPTSTVDAANLLRCNGEDLVANASQRCFGAGQPQPEICDNSNENKADWDCDGHKDVPSGKLFADSGRACGTDVGPCVAGTVTGCTFDPGLEIDNFELVESVLKDQNLTINRYWVCDGVVFPQEEVIPDDGRECRAKVPSTRSE